MALFSRRAAGVALIGLQIAQAFLPTLRHFQTTPDTRSLTGSRLAAEKREWWQSANVQPPQVENDGRPPVIVDEAVASQKTELPDSFDHALALAVEATRDAIDAGHSRIRVDFDTTLGDITYTTLKNSKPLAYVLAKFLASLIQEDDRVVQTDPETPPTYDGKRLVVVFPDMGSSALAEREWLVGEVNSTLPVAVRFTSFPYAKHQEDDGAYLIICPRASESESTYELVQEIPLDVPAVILNPELVDMGVVGFGLAGRRIRTELEDKFEHVYYLKTLNWGALIRKWPQGFSIWQEDETLPEGYRHMQTYGTFPDREALEEIIAVSALLPSGPWGHGLLKPIESLPRALVCLGYVNLVEQGQWEGVSANQESMQPPGLLGELAKFVDGFKKI